MSTRPTTGRRARACAVLTSVALVVVGFVTATGASGATPTFHAAGSVNQVYVTGLAPNASMSLVTSAGQTLETQRANSLGGLLFRNVPAASGYRVRSNSDGSTSPAVTVYAPTPAPWDPGIYNQSIPANGYTYLTTRDGTKLAVDVHPPTSPAGEPGLPPGTPLPKGPAYLPPIRR